MIVYHYSSTYEVLMNTTTVNVSFQGSLLAEIDRVAQTESRSRSELLREAARLYIDRKRRWDKLFAYGKTIALRGQLTEEDVAAEIRSYRKQKAAKR
jgi:CopG family transcriptional regulator / antitoxin EndoAI